MPTCTQISDTFLNPGKSPMFHMVLQVMVCVLILSQIKNKRCFLSRVTTQEKAGFFLSVTCWPNGVKLFGQAKNVLVLINAELLSNNENEQSTLLIQRYDNSTEIKHKFGIHCDHNDKNIFFFERKGWQDIGTIGEFLLCSQVLLKLCYVIRLINKILNCRLSKICKWI